MLNIGKRAIMLEILKSLFALWNAGPQGLVLDAVDDDGVLGNQTDVLDVEGPRNLRYDATP